MSQALPFVSVVTPVYNAAATIEACLQSLLALDYPRDRREIIVVDNGSSDETAAIVQRYPVQLLHELTRPSSYAARNRGIRASRGELIAFTDADCIAERGWLTHLVEGYADESVGAFAGSVLAHHPTTLLERFAEQHRVVSQEISMVCTFLPYAVTANAAYRREVLQVLGGFDDQFISGGDSDLSWRLQRVCGKRIRFNRSAIVYHRHRTTLRGLCQQYWKYGYGTVMLYERFPDYRKSWGVEVWFTLKRVSWFLARGMSRLARDPFRRGEGSLYFTEHFLDALCTLSRLLGMLQCQWQTRPPVPSVRWDTVGADHAIRLGRVMDERDRCWDI